MTDQRARPWTPGPWRWKVGDDFITADDGIAGTADIVERCQWYGEADLRAEAEANNHLIAAAPALYEALEALFTDYKQLADSGDAGNWSLEDQPVGKQVLAAIALARGEQPND